MNNRLFGILLVISILGTSFAGAFMEYFNGRTEGENVKLEWKTNEESNLKHFVIERKTPQTSFIELATVSPKGSNSFYSYLDESVYKSTNYIFIYRLKIVDKDQGFSYSREVSVSPNPSDVKRTWGSIKAMFR
ncbi:MAG: hypothetical protein HXY50_02260 [Ignavibacteriaceae bacterium]|nr:hypothetical protein [Ignavibacteriaceae bacterium]